MAHDSFPSTQAPTQAIPLPPHPKDLVGWVMTEARRLVRRTRMPLHPGELWASGCLGLLDACRRYDASRAVSFEPYARQRIRGAMLDQLRQADRIPRRARAQLREVEKAERRLSAEHASPPDVPTLANACGLPERTVHKLRLLRARAAPALDVHELEDRLADQGTHLEDGNHEVMRQLRHAFSQLPERAQDVLVQHYEGGATYRDIAQGLGVTESRVCQIHAAAIRQLRATM